MKRIVVALAFAVLLFGCDEDDPKIKSACEQGTANFLRSIGFAIRECKVASKPQCKDLTNSEYASQCYYPTMQCTETSGKPHESSCLASRRPDGRIDLVK